MDVLSNMATTMQCLWYKDEGINAIDEDSKINDVVTGSSLPISLQPHLEVEAPN